MLPHVIITRSYCSPARLLPPLSWRGSGQGQTGRAGRAETEYYHWGESCFMLLKRLGRLAGCTVTSPDRNSSLSNTRRQVLCAHTSIYSKKSNSSRFPSLTDLFKGSAHLSQTHAAHSHTSADRFTPSPPPLTLHGD